MAVLLAFHHAVIAREVAAVAEQSVQFGVERLNRAGHAENNRPGLTVDATTNRDFPVIQMIVLLSATAIVFANLLADVVYSLVDPRIKYS